MVFVSSNAESVLHGVVQALASSTNWMGGWVDPRASLSPSRREKIPFFCRESNEDRSESIRTCWCPGSVSNLSKV